MRGVIATLTVLWIIAAAVGTVTTGLFWLTLVSFAGMLMTGAIGLSMALRPTEKVAAPGAPLGELRALPSARPSPYSEPSEAARQWDRAA